MYKMVGLLMALSFTACRADGESVLAIGVNEFAHMDALESACDEAKTIRELLPSSDFVLMTDSEDGTDRFPVRHNILAQQKELDSDGLVFFSGYGVVHGPDLYLVPADGHPGQAGSLLSPDALAGKGILLLHLASPAAGSEAGLETTLQAWISKQKSAVWAVVGGSCNDFETECRDAMTGGADWSGDGNRDGVINLAELDAFFKREASAFRPVWSGHKGNHTLIRYDIPQVLSDWASINRLKSSGALSAAEATGPAFVAGDTAEKLFACGDVMAGQKVLSSVAPELAALRSSLESRLMATSLRRRAQHLFDLAKTMKLSSSAPAVYGTCFALMRTADAYYKQGRFVPAVEQYKKVIEKIEAPLWRDLNKKLEQPLPGIDVDDPYAFGGATGARFMEIKATAKLAAESGDMEKAGYLAGEALDLIPDLAESMAGGLYDLANEFDNQASYQTALVYLDKLLQIHPEHEAAVLLQRKLRANYRFKPGKTYTNQLGMNFVYIPAGSFRMGSPVNEPGHEKDETLHDVALSFGFFMAVTELTESQWDAVMGGTLRMKGAAARGKTLQHAPKNNVSWKDAVLYIKALRKVDNSPYRLPTEAEWEYACRAGTRTPYYLGSKLTGEDAVIYDPLYEVDGPLNPGKLNKPNAWGLHDMHGNLWEWCSDWFGPYEAGPLTDPHGPERTERLDLATKVARGGAWIDDPSMARSANRYAQQPTASSDSVGFRLVLDAWAVD